MTNPQIDRLLALSERATEGPWSSEPSCDEDENVYWSEDLNAPQWCIATPHTAHTASWLVDCIREADAAFIVAAVNFVRNDLPALLAERDAASARVGEMREALEPFARALNDWGEDRGQPDHWNIWEHPTAIGITLGDLRRARIARGEG